MQAIRSQGPTQTTIAVLDKILDVMMESSAMRRPSASEARDRLSSALSAMTPASLLIPLVLTW